ncbi:DUF5572 domain-containing protein [Aspergillus saccharolyticus JOP 1030-1]|uniref:Uncharacterized protein n=1 Tax=Aspergillus saccharolyticus JOP 1030-1 TaxID=1450539 RepID=A0A318ZAZ0_9EURO|nr:hypothetical protein BP01DRAFT_377685 [Aspergillus saccharolyticus JOP 1030-1]PYH40630.1 hypothetical protein BP01DRAFT_377685 [Aspergillus saccharolyticus JOP 1030-1]
MLENSEIKVFKRIKSFPFEEDDEFAHGLSIILGHPDILASKAEIERDDDITLQAKCFYFSRKENITPPVNVRRYQAWLQAGSVPALQAASLIDQQQIRNVTIAGHANAPLVETEPAYPSSFAHIVELITAGQPIPGIQQIPDTILIGQATPSTRSKRRKPWEQQSDNDAGK